MSSDSVSELAPSSQGVVVVPCRDTQAATPLTFPHSPDALRSEGRPSPSVVLKTSSSPGPSFARLRPVPRGFPPIT